MSANAQTTTPFETVFDACKKACEALDGGFASGEQPVSYTHLTLLTTPYV